MSGKQENSGQAVWGSKFGYLMVAAGAAIGLGNIWKFPYLAYRGGGGVFLVVYIIVVALLAKPMVEIETTIGRKAQADCVPKFLIAMLVAAAVGSYGFANIVTKWPRNKIRWALGIMMPLLAIVMFCKNMGFGPFGTVGTAIGLTGWKAAVAIILNVLWGALMDIGFGLYAPCMATCLMLGVDAGTCFPVFMGSCALLMPACSIAFIKTGRFDAVATLGNMIGGLIGVFIAWKLITSMPLFWLINLVCVVLLYTSYTLISSAIKEKDVA